MFNEVGYTVSGHTVQKVNGTYKVAYLMSSYSVPELFEIRHSIELDIARYKLENAPFDVIRGASLIRNEITSLIAELGDFIGEQHAVS